MTDEERIRLSNVLERVRIIHGKSMTLESSFNNLINVTTKNCVIDDKTPYEDDINNMSTENARSKSSFSRDVIPTLINRINS